MERLAYPVRLDFNWRSSYSRSISGFLRPMIPIRLSFHSQSLDLPALLDSGADQCLFPISVSFLLGIDLSQVETRRTIGTAGEVDTFYHPVDIEILGQRFAITAGFVNNPNLLPLLGREPLFSHFQFAFRQSRWEFYAADHP